WARSTSETEALHHGQDASSDVVAPDQLNVRAVALVQRRVQIGRRGAAGNALELTRGCGRARGETLRQLLHGPLEQVGLAQPIDEPNAFGLLRIDDAAGDH